jgi:N-acetyl-S-(2-succino)cysteine monooxygenase
MNGRRLADAVEPPAAATLAGRGMTVSSIAAVLKARWRSLSSDFSANSQRHHVVARTACELAKAPERAQSTANLTDELMTAPRQIKLGMFLRPAAHHIAGWRHKDAWADGGLNFARYVETAKAAERGLFDLLFSADALTGERYDRETLSRTTYVAWIDPMSLLTALSPVTQNIGLVCTATTTYDEPYHIARRFASLDLISGGRSGWNLVTSANDAESKNLGRDDHLPKEVRYRRAREFVEIVRGLWDSWDDDAFVFDKENGRFYDPDRRHVLDHAGEFFTVRGPLTVSRSPQGQPVVVQAGASDDGRQLAAETAEVVFCAHQSIDGARQYYRDVKERMVRCGRDPDHLKVMPGLGVMVAPTRQEAEDKYQELQDSSTRTWVSLCSPNACSSI